MVRKSKNRAELKLNKTQTLQIIANVCQRHGCEVLKVDFDKRVLDIQGPADAKKKCMQELEVLLD